MIEPSSMGQRIFNARKAAGLKQKELAEALELTPTALNYYEKDKRTPSIEVLKRMTGILNVSMNYLSGMESLDAEPVREAFALGKYADAGKVLGLPQDIFLEYNDGMILSSEEAVPYRSKASERASKPVSQGRAETSARMLALMAEASDEELDRLLAMAKLMLKKI